MHEKSFVERPKFLSVTSNLPVEQNFVHLGRFMHFSQKVVGNSFSQNCLPVSVSKTLNVRLKRFSDSIR